MLKLLVIFLLIFLIPNFSSGQINNPIDSNRIRISNTFWAKPDSTYLDSIKIDTKRVYLDPDNIKEIVVFKGPDALIFSGSKGAILITRKKKNPLLSLSSIKVFSNGNDTSQYRYIIDDKLITDTLNVRFEPSTIKNIDILKYPKESVRYDLHNKIDILIRTKLNQ